MEFAIDDLARGTDCERQIVVGHLDCRPLEPGVFEFLEQQVDEAMIDAACRDVTDAQNDLFEPVGDGLLHELVELAETSRKVAYAGAVEEYRDEIGRRVRMGQGNGARDDHAHVDRADLAGAYVVKQDAASGRAGCVHAYLAAADQEDGVAAIADPEQVAVPQILRVEQAHMLENSAAQFRRSVAVKRILSKYPLSNVLHACVSAPGPALACRAS